MATLNKKYVIKKRNVLNELRANNMSLQELRFFSIYLSKINPADSTTRKVRFPLEDFQKIMDLGRINIDYMKQVTNSLLCKVVNIPLEKGGYTAFQLFKKCTITSDDNNEWYIEIDAHDDALPLMFEFKIKYFTYQLWNALRLKSPNQLRMYEILKQYEKVGERILLIEELKQLIGIGKNEYERFGDFKIRVLDACQEALAEHTDIKYTYEPYGKKGKGGKILALKFKIYRNADYIDQLTLDEFIDLQGGMNEVIPTDEQASGEKKSENEFKNKRLELYSEMCNNEFNEQEIQIIYDLLLDIIPYTDELKKADYLKRAYDELDYRATRSKISNRFNYLRGILENKLKEKDE